ncbi:MAG: hypothetical protein GXY85_08005 [Candidatus Brocadiaceae bacterium]|nr:hypothetical protein [Candidatus Brocadiaceae bacterium]
MLASLPEGYGLAAEYPRDRGVERHSAVVFADGFERYQPGPLPGGFRKAQEKLWDSSGGACRVADAPDDVHGDGQALEMRIPRPGDAPGGAHVQKFFDPGFDALFLRYYAMFDASNDLHHGGAHNGGGIAARAPGVPQACPGIRADGSAKFTVVLDTWRSRPEVPSPGPLVTYVYHMDQGGRWGDQFFPSGRVVPSRAPIFGEHFVPRPDFIPEQGRWHCYELMVHANVPGRRDGRIAFWVDGRLLADFPNLRLRNVSSLKANRIDLGVYTHNSRTVRDVVMRFDDVVAATAYIGPQADVR